MLLGFIFMSYFISLLDLSYMDEEITKTTGDEEELFL